jgi:glucan phosphoethanolaminetransferase (alkaline phosphatase superfamily)
MIWTVLGVLAAAGLIVLIEVPRLWKKRLFKELTIFTALLITGTGLGIAQAAHVQLPNPLDWISYVFEPTGKWIFRMLK